MRALVALLVFTSLSATPLISTAETSAKIKLAELHDKARIVRDDFGIAHIEAENEHDVFFLQGWVHAQDRLFQMDLNRRQAGGTLAELFGPEALAADVQTRTIGLHRAAERSLPLLRPDTRAIVEAYAAGVNTYVARHPLPAEYGALEITRFRPWTALDVMAVAKLITFGLSFEDTDIANTEALLSAMAVLGPEAGQALFFEDIWRTESFSRVATVPDAQRVTTSDHDGDKKPGKPKRQHLNVELDVELVKQGRAFFDRMRHSKYLGWALDQKEPKGSNQWAISGRHTTSGQPLLANDPHLRLGTPSTFYPLHLRSPELDVIGNGFPGVPSIVTGHNRDIAWGATVNPLDVTDFYAETLVPDGDSPSGLSTLYQGSLEAVTPIPEQFYFNLPGNGTPDDMALADPAVHGVPTATLIVPRRNNGPLISVATTAAGLRGLSLQFTGFSGTRELETFLDWDRARNLADFRRGLDTFDVGSENWAYADRKGNIAYFTSAEMPIREDLQAMTVNGLPPFFIRNGEGGNEWLPVQNPQPGQAIPYEILPHGEMPQIVNPPAGWFINANNDPAGTTLDNDALNQLRPAGGIYYLNQYYDSLRAGRLTQLLEDKLAGHGKIGFADIQAMQADVVLLDAQVLTPYLLSAMDHARHSDALPALAALSSDSAVMEAIERLRHWNFNTPTGIDAGYDASDNNGEQATPSAGEINDSIAATLYAVWRGRVVQNTLDSVLDGLGLSDIRPGDPQSIAALRHLLEQFDTQQGYGLSGVNFFAAGGTGDPSSDRDIVLLRSLQEALALLASDDFAAAFAHSGNQDDYRWGRLHRIVFEHPLGAPFSIPPAAGAFPAPFDDLPGIPTDGGFGTPDAAFHVIRANTPADFQFSAGPVNRFAAQLDKRGPQAESIWPGGTSGVLGDPHYSSMLPLWLTNDTVPLLQDKRELKRHRASVTVFTGDSDNHHPDDEEHDD